MVVEPIKVGDKVRHYAGGRIVMEVVKITGDEVTCKFLPSGILAYEYPAWQLDKIEETGEVQ